MKKTREDCLPFSQDVPLVLREQILKLSSLLEISKSEVTEVESLQGRP